MAESIVIVGPQGCGKNLNGKGLAKAFGLKHWIDADTGIIPKQDHVILANEVPRGAEGLKVVAFSEAIKLVGEPHPMTPGYSRPNSTHHRMCHCESCAAPTKITFAFSTGQVDFLTPDAKGRRFWPVTGA